MSSPNSINKDSVKDLYYEMKQRIRMVINLLGTNPQDKKDVLPDDRSFETISNLINSIMGSAKFEANNQYRDAIVEITEWMNAAFQKDFINQYSSLSPTPLFIIRKGVDILHSFLHRDLRRKQLSSEEHEIYQSFMALVNNLPDPKKEKLSQDEADSLIDDLLKSS